MAIVKLALSVLAALAILAQASFDYFGVRRDVLAGFAGSVEALDRARAALDADDLGVRIPRGCHTVRQ